MTIQLAPNVMLPASGDTAQRCRTPRTGAIPSAFRCPAGPRKHPICGIGTQPDSHGANQPVSESVPGEQPVIPVDTKKNASGQPRSWPIQLHYHAKGTEMTNDIDHFRERRKRGSIPVQASICTGLRTGRTRAGRLGRSQARFAPEGRARRALRRRNNGASHAMARATGSSSITADSGA
jgi:hypothetical protein